MVFGHLSPGSHPTYSYRRRGGGPAGRGRARIDRMHEIFPFPQGGSGQNRQETGQKLRLSRKYLGLFRARKLRK